MIVKRFSGIRVPLSALLIFLASSLSAEIYQWKDENGRVHFGDKPDEAIVDDGHAKKISIRKKTYLPLDVNFSTVEYSLPPDTQFKTTLAIRKMREIYLDYLGLNLKDLSEFNIKIFGSKESFSRYRDKHFPNSESATGVFWKKRNEAIVWKNKNFKRMLGVTTHEMSHALIAMEFSRPPRWLNEGLAEYVESMEVSGQSITLSPQDYWLKVVRKHAYAKDLPSLSQLINWPAKSWKARNKKDGLSYAMSWSLVHFLMSSKDNRNVLKQYLEDLSQSERQFNSAKSMDKAYPGGMKKLEQDWENWISRSFIASHTY